MSLAVARDTARLMSNWVSWSVRLCAGAVAQLADALSPRALCGVSDGPMADVCRRAPRSLRRDVGRVAPSRRWTGGVLSRVERSSVVLQCESGTDDP